MPKLITLERADYTLATELAARGCAEDSIAEALFLSPRTLRNLKQRDERLVEAIARGRAIEHDELVGILLGQAREGNTVAAIFLLKARHGYRDRGDTPGAAAAAAVNVTITLPDSMSREAWAKTIEGETSG